MSSNSVYNHTRDKQIRLPLRGRPIFFITRMITDRIGLHSVLLPLIIIARVLFFSFSLHGAAIHNQQDGRTVLFLDGNDGTYADTPAFPLDSVNLTIAAWIKPMGQWRLAPIYGDWSSPYHSFRFYAVGNSVLCVETMAGWIFSVSYRRLHEWRVSYLKPLFNLKEINHRMQELGEMIRRTKQNNIWNTIGSETNNGTTRSSGYNTGLTEDIKEGA